MTMMNSWNEENELVELYKLYRNNEVVYGIIRGFTERQMPTQKEGKVVTTNLPVYQVVLPGNVIGYCPIKDFRESSLSERVYQNYVGRREPFIITGLDEKNQLAILSGTQALDKLKDAFWSSIADKADEEVMEQIYEATVVNYNPNKGIVYLLIQGQLTYMFRSEWSWNEREAVDAQEGEKVKVRIILMDRERQIVRVSRKKATPDPFEFLADLKIGSTIAGRVSDINPKHGIFVQFDNNAEIKATVPRSVEAPSLNDIVSCRVKEINLEERKGRVVITGYPNGKKRVNDIGAFLYGQ